MLRAVLGGWRTPVVPRALGIGFGSTGGQVPLLQQIAFDTERKVGLRFPQAESNICQARSL